MIPGKNQTTIVEAEVYGLQGPVTGFVRVQADGIFIGENRVNEVGLTWNELLRLLEHPAIAQELSAHSIGFTPGRASSP